MDWTSSIMIAEERELQNTLDSQSDHDYAKLSTKQINQATDIDRIMKWTICDYCGETISRKNLIRHCRKWHFEKEKKPPNPSIKCFQCFEIFGQRGSYVQHIKDNHGVNEDYVSIGFKNSDEFYKWKAKFESDSGYRFIIDRNHNSKHRKVFLCNHSGHFRPNKPTNGRKPVKLNWTCPAYITTQGSRRNSVIMVDYFPFHCHDQQTTVLPLYEANIESLDEEKIESSAMDCLLSIENHQSSNDTFDSEDPILINSNNSTEVNSNFLHDTGDILIKKLDKFFQQTIMDHRDYVDILHSGFHMIKTQISKRKYQDSVL